MSALAKSEAGKGTGNIPVGLASPCISRTRSGCAIGKVLVVLSCKKRYDEPS
jgi:hypothetical protein